MAGQEERINKQERYSQRWCQCLLGIAENQTENVKATVKEICKVMIPGAEKDEVAAAVNVAGHLKAGEDKNVKPWLIIIRYVFRTTFFKIIDTTSEKISALPTEQ